jgi:acyl-CoA oxidase
LYAKKTLRFHKLIGYNEKSADICTAVFPEQLPTLMNLKMFVPTIRLIGTEKQVEKWIPLANKFEIIGCYA